MLSSSLPLPISSHYYFILPSVCTSRPHFAFLFALLYHFLSDLLGGQSSMGRDTKEVEQQSRGLDS